MRLFVALTPPADAMAELEAAVAPLRDGWPDLRWASQDRWHVTLAFLGEVAEPKLAGLATRLERAAARHPGQQLTIGRAGAFPGARKAQVLIARIEPLTDLAALAASVAAGARRAGASAPDEGRKYRPHLTLARSRQPADITDLIQSLAGFAGQPFTTTEIHLIKSHLGPPPSYETLASYPLA